MHQEQLLNTCGSIEVIYTTHYELYVCEKQEIPMENCSFFIYEKKKETVKYVSQILSTYMLTRHNHTNLEELTKMMKQKTTEQKQPTRTGII